VPSGWTTSPGTQGFHVANQFRLNEEANFGTKLIRKLEWTETQRRQKKKKTTRFTSQCSIRFLDTVLLLIFSLENSISLAIDRESTPPLENFFAFMGMDSGEINTSKEMTITISHVDVVKESTGILELGEHVSGRVSLAGVHRGETAPQGTADYIERANVLAPEAISSICLKAVHAREGSLAPEFVEESSRSERDKE
jgi:hypothetical protein